MNQYPEDFIVHNLPLIVLSGLESDTSSDTSTRDKGQAYLGDGGFRIRAELPPLHHPATESLRNILLSFDTSQAPWHSPPSDRTDANHAFKILSIGRTFTFSPRKAPPPPHSPRLRPTDLASPPPLTSHSTLSPLSPNSPLYPNGIFTPLWITKHQHRLPSVLVCFYNLISDNNTSSLEDNKIKNEVNNIRSLIASTNYKTKFVIVIVADGAIIQSDAEERLLNIRKGTNFDGKALYYLPFTSSIVELKEFARVLFATLNPICIEYYRDLSKHARRKRNRNSTPQPTVMPPQGTVAVLPLHGWNARYEFKLGVFAEFRQEMEAACRNYESAYDILLGADLLDFLSTSDSRFNEARILADIIAIRIIRCFLWSSQAAAAVKWWTKHRDRTRDLLNRKGRVTTSHDSQTWHCSWSQVAAELVERSHIFSFALSQLPANSLLPVQLPVDRNALIQEKLAPWENLHHEGYWLNHARKIIEVQRMPTSQRPGGQRHEETANIPDELKAHSPDNNLGLNPNEQHAVLGVVDDVNSDVLNKVMDHSIHFFDQRQQRRMIEMLQFHLHTEQVRTKDLSKAIPGLRSLWRQSLWRTQGWWKLLEEVGARLLTVAMETHDHELCLLLLWELLAFTESSRHSSLPTAINGPVSAAAVVTTSFPRVSPLFAFGTSSGHVGEPVTAQLCLKLFGKQLPFGFRITELKVMFEGGISPVLIAANEAGSSTSSSVSIADVDLQEITVSTEKTTKRLSLIGTSYLGGQADLTLDHENRIYTFHLVPREAGPVSVASIVLSMSNDTQELSFTTIEFQETDAVWWEMRGGRPVARPFGMQRDVTTLTVLPKPPKLEINLPNLMNPYYTNETVELSIVIENEEEETIVDIDMQVRLLSPVRGDTIIRWNHDQTLPNITEGSVQETVRSLPSVTLSEMASKATRTFILNISELLQSMDHEMEINIAYALQADTTTKLTKTAVIDLSVIRPFETSTTFSPRVHEMKWDDFFAASLPDMTSKPSGLAQKYLVKADLVSFAREQLNLESSHLVISRVLGGAVCTSSPGRTTIAEDYNAVNLSKELAQLAPDQVKDFYFDLDIQKLVLRDRQPVAIDLEMQITWSRVGSTERNTSALLIPKFMAPVAEPRVLLQSSKIDTLPGMYLLRYTIENPSMHFLTFSITMEGGEGLAFSGPKIKNVSLVPISRWEVEYRVHAQKNNEWASIQLQVLDAFFGQTLKVQPASESVRVDKQGNVQIWLGS